jgi:arginine decarboxylase
MMVPTIKVVVLEDDQSLLEQISLSLQKSIGNFERNDMNFQVLECASAGDCLQLIKDDGDVQAVIMSWDIRARWEEISGDQEGHIEHNAAIIAAIKGIRQEIPVYILGDDEKGMQIIHESVNVESFFYRNDIIIDPEFILGYILNDLDDRTQTPFWTSYKKYVVESNDSWHTPGHSGGASFRHSPYISDFYQFYGRNVFVSDLSISVDSLGSLSDSSNAIGRAQEAAAYTFEVQKTYFVTNGSSTANKIILQTVLRKGDKIIIDRNCHKSVHYGIIQAHAYPIYLNSVLNQHYGIFAPPSLDDIRAAIDTNPDAKLIVLTGCTYDGLLSDLKQVVDLAHAKGIKVFIDEAWFAYSLFHPQFRYYSAINAGADYITHSAHKVLSAFSQASYIHINDPDFDHDFFREIYSIYTSTSPKYQLIASLDVCHKQLEMEGYKIINSLLQHIEELKGFVSKFKRIKILGPDDFANMFPHFKADNMGHDPLKILIDISQLDYSMSDIHRFLMDEIGLEIEKYTHSTLLVLLTLGGTRSKVIRLYNALKKLEDGKAHLTRSKVKAKIPSDIPAIDLKMLPSEAFFGGRESIPLEHTVGRIAAGLVTPYPPGIPLLVPGQLIEKVHLDYIKALASQKLTIQGMFDGEIYVLSQ